MNGMAQKLYNSPAIAPASLATWLLADALRFAVFISISTDGLITLISTIILLATAVYVLTRPPPLEKDWSKESTLAAITAIIWPSIFLVIERDAYVSTTATTIQLCALVLMAAATSTLGKNFSVLPQYRTLVFRGPYAIVRHPLYTAYLTFNGTIVFDTGSAVAAVLWVIEAILLAWRAKREENFLVACNGEYAEYLLRVRFRFVPLVY
jgi:protein-S-isoprenylcysteine O-methyltransferase Ste14